MKTRYPMKPLDLEEHPIVLVWLDQKLREPTIPPVTVDTLLMLMADEYDITNEDLDKITGDKRTRLQQRAPGSPGNSASVYAELRKRSYLRQAKGF